MEDKKVLFIDGEDFFRKLYKRKLTEKGAEFLEAQNGDKGWELIEKENPDLVITEVTFQGMDGFKILKKINEEELNIPVIFLTNLAQESDKKDAKELGAAGYFVKQECNLSDVMKKIEETLS